MLKIAHLILVGMGPIQPLESVQLVHPMLLMASVEKVQ
jgi:hypothetical protein